MVSKPPSRPKALAYTCLASLHRPDSRQVSVASASHLGVPSHGEPFFLPLSWPITDCTGLTQTLQPLLQNKVSVHDNSSGQSGGLLSFSIDLRTDAGADPSMAPKLAKAPAKPRKPKDPNAPKRPRGRPRKDGTLPRVKQEGKSPTSSYDSESDSDLEIEGPPEPMPEILKSDRPNDFDGKVLFDTVQAVWSPRNKLAVPDKIRTGIAQFGETIRKLRDAWKAKNAALQQAENANSSNVPNLKGEVGQYRRLMQNVAETAVKLGHPAHLKKYVCTSPFSLHGRQLSAGSPWFAVEIISKYVQVEAKIWPIFQRLKNRHSKGLALFLDCHKAWPDLALFTSGLRK